MWEITVLDKSFGDVEIGTYDCFEMVKIGDDVDGIGCEVVKIGEMDELAKTAIVYVEWLD